VNLPEIDDSLKPFLRSDITPDGWTVTSLPPLTVRQTSQGSVIVGLEDDAVFFTLRWGQASANQWIARGGGMQALASVRLIEGKYVPSGQPAFFDTLEEAKAEVLARVRRSFQ
jgi:hypothetical protein